MNQFKMAMELSEEERKRFKLELIRIFEKYTKEEIEKALKQLKPGAS